MEGFAGHPLVCRACLRIVENKTQSFGFIEDANGNLKDMIMCCVPEMDIYVSSNPIMCFPCIQLLVNVYNFKTRCLNTETIIRSYIQRHNLSEYNHVSLSCIVQELIRLNDYFRDAHLRKMDGDKQNMDNYPQNPNGMPRVPHGIPQGMPGCHFRLSENHAMSMDHQNVQGDHVMGPPLATVHGDMGNVSINMNRNPNATQDKFIPRHEDVEEHRGMLHGIPVNPVLIKNPDTPSELTLMKDGVVTNPETEKHRDTSDKEEVESMNAQNYEECTDNSFGHNVHSGEVENHSNKPEDQTKTANNSSEEEEQGEESVVTLHEESSEQTNRTDMSHDSIPSKSEIQNDSVAENRPRLIIRICKNKITIPSNKNEDSNEKENEKMDVEMNSTEIQPLESNPFDTYQSQDNELFQCSSCTFITTHLDSYIIHKKMCGSELSEKKCPHCPHVTNRQYALNKHINTMHTKSVWYTCDNCPYRSTDSSCLRRHKRNVHPDGFGTELVCQLCAYHCTTEYHFKKHMLKHTDNAPLQCQFCSYSTRDRSNFRKHIFIHNPTPQGCEFCDYKCVSPYQMKLHLKKFHHGVGMEDVDCRSEVSISEVVQDISAAIKEAKGSAGHQTE